jgi:hypothetical protein
MDTKHRVGVFDTDRRPHSEVLAARVDRRRDV